MMIPVSAGVRVRDFRPVFVFCAISLVGIAAFAAAGDTNLTAATNSPALANPAAQNSALSRLFIYFKAGGPVMWPLLAAFSFGTFHVINQALQLMQEKRKVKRVIESLQGAKPKNLEEFAQSFGEDLGIAGVVIVDGIGFAKHGLGEAEKAMDLCFSREVNRVKRRLRWLNVIATVTPLLGLLGTVVGMIVAFKGTSMAGAAKAEMMAAGISEALYATAFGLAIAISSLFAYQCLMVVLDELVEQVDECVQKAIAVLKGESSGS